jgi:hypothetical protein
VSFFERIFEATKAAWARHEHAVAVHRMISQTISEGLREDQDAEQIARRVGELGASDKDLKEFGSTLVSTAVQLIRQEASMSPKEEQTLLVLADRCGVPEREVTKALSGLSKFRLVYDIDHGTLPTVNVPGLLLRKGETACWSEPAAIIEERVVSREYVGGSSGVSFRLAKGVHYRVGGFRGHVEAQKGMVPVSRGSLVLTNQRLIFQGDRKSFDVPWDKVLDIEFFGNGIRFARTGQSKTTLIQFDRPGNTDVIGKLISHIVNNPQG